MCLSALLGIHHTHLYPVQIELDKGVIEEDPRAQPFVVGKGDADPLIVEREVGAEQLGVVALSLNLALILYNTSV